MNAETKVENANLAIWNALSKTDPKHTKQFSRAGGFKGTALKPIWIVKMLTEQFGPVGKGWGMGEPQFQIVHSLDGEVLVYCTVKAWHGTPENAFYGVGGDKAVAKRNNGMFCDDEAYKKAFTDAVNNAFKFAGVGADIHMGLFEDSKYVEEVAAEFEAHERTKIPGISKIKDRLRKLKTEGNEATDLEAFNALVHDCKDELTKIRDGEHPWWTGDGNDEEGFKAWIVRRREELADSQYKALIDSLKQCETKAALAKWLEANGDAVDELSDIERRKFQLAWDMHESAITQMDTVTAGA